MFKTGRCVRFPERGLCGRLPDIVRRAYNSFQIITRRFYNADVKLLFEEAEKPKSSITLMRRIEKARYIIVTITHTLISLVNPESSLLPGGG